MVEARSKSAYISKIKVGTWWSQIKNKSIYPNPKKGMVEARWKICYMPKRSSKHGGAKQMFTKYAQHKGGYADAQQKNPDPLRIRILWYSLAFISAWLQKQSWASALSRVQSTASGSPLTAAFVPWLKVAKPKWISILTSCLHFAIPAFGGGLQNTYL